LWCIGNRGFVLGRELGMAIDEDPILHALKVDSERKDRLEKGICQFGSPKKRNNECYHGVEKTSKSIL
jgi:hypothetical protein